MPHPQAGPVAGRAGSSSPRSTRRTGCRTTPAIAVSVLAMPMKPQDASLIACATTKPSANGSDHSLRGEQLADHHVAVADDVQHRAAGARP